MENSYFWYQMQKKPSWAPPKELFGPVWALLYILIFISFGAVVIKVFEGDLPNIILIPFILNLVFNFIFTPIQFQLKNNYLASLDITLIFITLIWFILAIYPFMSWVAYLNIPYLLWVSFALVLQFTVTYLNRVGSQKEEKGI